MDKIKDSYFKYLYILPLALFVYMPFHVFLSTWLSTYTGGLEGWRIWKDFLTTALAFAFIVTVYVLGRQTRLFNWILGLSVVYGLTHLVLLLIKPTPTSLELLSSAYNLRIFGYLIIGYSLVLIFNKKNILSIYTKWLIFISTIVCVFGFLQWILPKDLLTNFGYEVSKGVWPMFYIDNKPDFPRVFSTLRDPNSLGAFLLVPIAILLQKLTKNWHTDKKMFLSGLLALHVLILILTFSRSGLLALITLVVVFFILQNRSVFKKINKKTAYILVGLAVFITVGFVATKDTYLVQNYVFHADESTVLADPNELRIQFAKKSIDGILAEPLGNGPATAGLVSIRNPEGGLLTENYFLQILYEVGVFGFVLFAVIIYLILKTVWLSKDKEYSTILLASFAGLVVVNMLFHAWQNESVAIVWFMLVGIFIAQDSRSKITDPKQ